MKTTKHIWLLSLTIASGLWFGANTSLAQVSSTTEADGDESEPTNAQAAESSVAEAVVATNGAPEISKQPSRIQRGAVVFFGRDVELKAGETADAVVVIGGSATIHGKVREAVVAIGGDVDVEGKVGDAAVAILGNVKAGPKAKVRGALVAVGGNVDAEGTVGGEAVAVLGNIKAGPKAVIDRDVVSVGGTIDLAEGATVKGQVQEVSVGIPGLPKFEGLSKWFRYCVLELRPLAPQVGWVWIVAGGFFLVYLLVALAFPRAVQVCVEELTKRPATTFAIGLLTKILLPVVYIVLLMTGIGVFVIPFIHVALFLGVIVGKVGLFEYLGGALGRPFGLELLRRPLVAFVLGIVLITLLYMVPILGFLTYVVVGIWGLGVLITVTFSRMKRETPRRPVEPPPAYVVPPMFAAVAAAPMPGGGTGAGAGESTQLAAAPIAPAGVPPIHPSLPVALAYPKAGFWERMGAAFLDVVLVGILAAIVGASFGHYVGPSIGYLIALAYFAGLWAWKGTTVGGAVLKLQVVRYDGGPVTFLVALVRGLAAAFSVVVLFLGFFWIGWDRDKQGWHDKIAGTVVVRLPRSLPLVCL